MNIPIQTILRLHRIAAKRAGIYDFLAEWQEAELFKLLQEYAEGGEMSMGEADPVNYPPVW